MAKSKLTTLNRQERRLDAQIKKAEKIRDKEREVAKKQAAIQAKKKKLASLKK